MVNKSVIFLFKYIFFILCTVCIILNSGYALATGNNKLLAISLAILTIVLFIIYIVKKKKFDIKNKTEQIVIILILSILFAFIINYDLSSFLEYLRYFMFVLSGYFVAKLITFDQFIYYFSRIMRFVAISSILMFLSIKFGIISDLPIAENGYGVSYYNTWFFLTQVSTNLRNSAIFWEPGLYAGFLALALAFEVIFLSNTEKNFKYILFFVVAMITTQSTSGYLYLILIFILIVSKNANGFKQSLIFITAILTILYLYWNFNAVLNHLVAYSPQVFQKLQSQNLSYTDRVLNPIIDLYILLHYPLGCGIGKLTSLVQQISNDLAIMVHTRTSTLTFFFAAFGFIGGLGFNATWLYGFIKNNGLNSIRKVTLIVLFILIASSSPLNSNMAIWIMVFVFFQSVQKHVKDLNHRRIRFKLS